VTNYLELFVVEEMFNVAACAGKEIIEANDLVAFGKPFISNPDLVRRLREGAPLNQWDKNTFYGGGEAGYIDYPALA